MRNFNRSRKNVARARLAQIAESVAAGDPVHAETPATRRQVLVGGLQRSTPNHHLLATTLRYVPKGRDTFLGCVLRAARNEDPDAKAFMRVFEQLHLSEQQVVDFDDVCEACGVTPDRLMAIAVSTMMKMGNDTADFVSAVFHPKIVHQTAKSAMRIGGEHAAIAQRDREMMLQHSKFIQGPKGVSVSVTAAAQAAAAAQSAPSVPTFADSVLGAQQTHFSVQRGLIEAGEEA